MTKISVAVLGAGSVGSQVARLLIEQKNDLEARVGATVELVGVAVRSLDSKRDADIPSELLTTDAAALVERDDVNLVVEVIGGIEPARTLILSALEHGASVVTANKALLAEDGPTLYEAAAKADRDLYFEAAVAGAIPILRPLRESLAGDRVTRVMGIVNGTTNFILDKMDSEGADFGEVLAEAQRLGFAESDPTADIEGFDAAAKAAILASLAFHTRVTVSDVYREGITSVTAEAVTSAQSLGGVVKLLAIAELVGDKVGVRVHPVMISRTHPLASVRGAFNAVFVESEAAGQLMFYGRGAGGSPTASAVLGDVVTAARNLVAGSRGVGESAYADLAILPIGESRTRYHIAIDVDDRAGVLAEIATEFARHSVSIQSLRQEGHGADAQLVVVSHEATDAQLSATVEALKKLDSVRAVTFVMRVEGEES